MIEISQVAIFLLANTEVAFKLAMPKTHPLPSLQTIVGQKNGKKIVQAEGFLTAPFRLNVIYSSIRYANFDEHSPFPTVV